MAPAPGRCRPRTSCLTAAPAGARREAAVGAGGAGVGREHGGALGRRAARSLGQPTAGSLLSARIRPASPGLSVTPGPEPIRHSVSDTDE